MTCRCFPEILPWWTYRGLAWDDCRLASGPRLQNVEVRFAAAERLPGAFVFVGYTDNTVPPVVCRHVAHVRNSATQPESRYR